MVDYIFKIFKISTNIYFERGAFPWYISFSHVPLYFLELLEMFLNRFKTCTPSIVLICSIFILWNYQLLLKQPHILINLINQNSKLV